MFNTRNFYKELGNLFYSIAAADHKIRPEEKKALDDEIQYAWKHFDDSKDRYGSDRAFLIQFEFEAMEDELRSPEEAFQSFEDYFHNVQEQLDPATRKRIFNSARHIAESVRKINKEELGYLERLKKLMSV